MMGVGEYPEFRPGLPPANAAEPPFSGDARSALGGESMVTHVD